MSQIPKRRFVVPVNGGQYSGDGSACKRRYVTSNEQLVQTDYLLVSGTSKNYESSRQEKQQQGKKLVGKNAPYRWVFNKKTASDDDSSEASAHGNFKGNGFADENEDPDYANDFVATNSNVDVAEEMVAKNTIPGTITPKEEVMQTYAAETVRVPSSPTNGPNNDDENAPLQDKNVLSTLGVITCQMNADREEISRLKFRLQKLEERVTALVRNSTAKQFVLTFDNTRFNGIPSVYAQLPEYHQKVDVVQFGKRFYAPEHLPDTSKFSRFTKALFSAVFGDAARAYSGYSNTAKYKLVPEDVQEALKGALYIAAGLRMEYANGRFVFPEANSDTNAMDGYFYNQLVEFCLSSRRIRNRKKAATSPKNEIESSQFDSEA